jgi:hypothetical protein
MIGDRWKIRHPFQYTTEAHNENDAANLTSVKCRTNVGRTLGVDAAAAGAKCEKIPHRPGHDVPEKADDEPAPLPPPATEFDVEVSLVGDPRQSGRRVDRDRGRRRGRLAVVRHRRRRIEEGGDDDDPRGRRGDGS